MCGRQRGRVEHKRWDGSLGTRGPAASMPYSSSSESATCPSSVDVRSTMDVEGRHARHLTGATKICLTACRTGSCYCSRPQSPEQSMCPFALPVPPMHPAMPPVRCKRRFLCLWPCRAHAAQREVGVHCDHGRHGFLGRVLAIDLALRPTQGGIGCIFAPHAPAGTPT